MLTLFCARLFNFYGRGCCTGADRTHICMCTRLECKGASSVETESASNHLYLQVALTTMAKLQEQSIISPGEGDSTDDVTYVDVLSSVRLSNSACHTILSKLIASILRHESSESLRRRYRYHSMSFSNMFDG